jgi:hypothetical protein
MSIKSTTVWQSSHSAQFFATREHAEEFEAKIVPRLAISAVLQHEGRVDSDDDAIIDKIVAALGELWGVRGFEKPDLCTTGS